MKAYRLNDSATVEVDRFEYGRLTLEGSNVTFDALTSARQDLSFHTFEHKCVEHLGISELTPDIMRTLRLLGKDGYTNAAAILADKNDFPGIDCVRFGDTEDVILDREAATNISAIEQVDRAVALCLHATTVMSVSKGWSASKPIEFLSRRFAKLSQTLWCIGRGTFEL